MLVQFNWQLEITGVQLIGDLTGVGKTRPESVSVHGFWQNASTSAVTFNLLHSQSTNVVTADMCYAVHWWYAEYFAHINWEKNSK